MLSSSGLIKEILALVFGSTGSLAVKISLEHALPPQTARNMKTLITVNITAPIDNKMDMNAPPLKRLLQNSKTHPPKCQPDITAAIAKLNRRVEENGLIVEKTDTHCCSAPRRRLRKQSLSIPE